MNSPKLIIKSAYIKNLTHVINSLEYSGNKISHQQILLNNGEVLSFNDDYIDLEKYNLSDISKISITLKDGKEIFVTPERYKQMVLEKNEKITVSKLVAYDNKIDSSEPFRKMSDLDFERYLEYIEDRPGAVKSDIGGLFGLGGDISIDDAKAMAIQHQDSRVWSHIISIPTDDAKTLGYDNRRAWQDYIISIAPNIAKMYNISLENLVINAAYHNNTDNPHVHLIMYSKDKTEGYLIGGAKTFTKVSKKLKSRIVNDIYKDETDRLKSLITENRQNMKIEFKQAMENINNISPELNNKFLDLATTLDAYKGKPVYGYMSPEIKIKVQDIIKELIYKNASIHEIFKDLENSQSEYIKMYSLDDSKVKKELKEWKRKFISPSKGENTSLHNIIVQGAINYNKEFTPLTQKKPAAEIKNYDDYLFSDDEIAFYNGENEQSIENINYEEYVNFDNDINDVDIKDSNQDIKIYEEYLKELKIKYEKQEYTNAFKDISKNVSKDLKNNISSLILETITSKPPLSLLQNELIFLMKEIQDSENIQKDKHNKFLKILKTDTNFYDKFNKSIDLHTKNVLMKYEYSKESEKAIKNYLHNLENGNVVLSIDSYVKYSIDNMHKHAISNVINDTREENKSSYLDIHKDIILCIKDNISDIKDEIYLLNTLDIKENYKEICNCLTNIKSKILNETVNKKLQEIGYNIYDNIKIIDDFKPAMEKEFIEFAKEDNLMLPGNYFIFKTLTENLNKTYNSSLNLKLKNDIKNLNKLIYIDIMNALNSRQSPIYKALKYNTMDTNISIGVLDILKSQNPLIDREIENLRNKFNISYENITGTKAKEQDFNDSILNNEFNGITSNIEYILSKANDIISKNNKDKLNQFLFSLLFNTNNILSSNTENNRNYLSKNNEKALSKKRGNLSRKNRYNTLGY